MTVIKLPPLAKIPPGDLQRILERYLGQLQEQVGRVTGAVDTSWDDPVDADIVPDGDGTRDIGTTGLRFQAFYVDDIVVTNLVDGRDISVDGAKLDLIEDSATADQTAVEIETLYNAQVAEVTQADAEAGSSTTVFRWTPERVRQASLDVEILAWLGV